MAMAAQPARKSYFFGKCYSDVGRTIKGAWIRNGESIKWCGRNIANSKGIDGTFVFIIKLIANIFGIVAIAVAGSIVTVVMSAGTLAVFGVVMLAIYLTFSIVWAIDRIYLSRKKIFTACNECKEKSLIPTYICPNCRAKHTNLTPSVYGILHRECTGTNPNSYCGYKLSTTFFNGRRNYEAECPHCGTKLMDRETVPICIPIVGGRSVGKTAFITAFSKEFFDEVAPKKSWELEFYNNQKEQIYNEITADYQKGSTRMTDRPQDISKPSSVSFSYFIKGREFKPERLIHVYDIAGEVFTDNSENEIQKQYEYCQGMVLIIDPFAIPSVRNRLEEKLTPEDIAGIGKADINGIVDSFLNKLREVTGLSDKKMSDVPLAVVISKIDSAGLELELGDAAIRTKMAENPAMYNDYYNTQDYLCREFLKANGMESFLNNVSLKFKDNRFFACTAIGHTRDKGAYKPQGVLPPMEWLFGKADKAMSKAWNDIVFIDKGKEKKDQKEPMSA